jgi:hypothetical protein
VLAVWLTALLVPLIPVGVVSRASELDRRLQFGDRLATAWVYRDSSQPIVQLQREDAIARLTGRDPRRDLTWRPTTLQLAALGALALVTVLLATVPSPQQAVLDRQAAQAAAVQRASDRLEALRAQAATANATTSALTPEQAKKLDEMVRQAQEQLGQVKTEQEANGVLAQLQDQVNQQLGDPNASQRQDALAAMSETLAAEPLTKNLADALQSEDSQAVDQSLKDLAQKADSLSDVERQGLSRALQRASNVGRSDPSSAAAMRAASRALSADDAAKDGSNESTRDALDATNSALQQSIQAAAAQASVRTTTQRLRDLQAQMANGNPQADDSTLPSLDSAGDNPFNMPPGSGSGEASSTPVALTGSSAGTGDLAIEQQQQQQGKGAGYGAAAVHPASGDSAEPTAAEDVFVPGREGQGPSQQDLTDQPFTVRGAPRPYRDVLSQYAQTSREYVDSPDVSPAVRELVKQYFEQLQDDQ